MKAGGGFKPRRRRCRASNLTPQAAIDGLQVAQYRPYIGYTGAPIHRSSCAATPLGMLHRLKRQTAPRLMFDALCTRAHTPSVPHAGTTVLAGGHHTSAADWCTRAWINLPLPPCRASTSSRSQGMGSISGSGTSEARSPSGLTGVYVTDTAARNNGGITPS